MIKRNWIRQSSRCVHTGNRLYLSAKRAGDGFRAGSDCTSCILCVCVRKKSHLHARFSNNRNYFCTCDIFLLLNGLTVWERLRNDSESRRHRLDANKLFETKLRRRRTAKRIKTQMENNKGHFCLGMKLTSRWRAHDVQWHWLNVQ